MNFKTWLARLVDDRVAQLEKEVDTLRESNGNLFADLRKEQNKYKNSIEEFETDRRRNLYELAKLQGENSGMINMVNALRGYDRS